MGRENQIGLNPTIPDVRRPKLNPATRLATVFALAAASALTGGCKFGNPSTLEIETTGSSSTSGQSARIEIEENLFGHIDFSTTVASNPPSRANPNFSFWLSFYLNGEYWSSQIIGRP